jgi:hypothetical protein
MTLASRHGRRAWLTDMILRISGGSMCSRNCSVKSRVLQVSTPNGLERRRRRCSPVAGPGSIEEEYDKGWRHAMDTVLRNWALEMAGVKQTQARLILWSPQTMSSDARTSRRRVDWNGTSRGGRLPGLEGHE